MFEHLYQHPEMEYSTNDKNKSPAMRSLKWAIEKEIREKKLKKDGITLIYCEHRNNGIKEHEVEIQESRGKYSLFVDNKSIYTADNLDDCVRWAKAAGHLDKSAKITGTRSAATKMVTRPRPATPATHKETSKTSAADILKKYLSWKSPSIGRHWR